MDQYQLFMDVAGDIMPSIAAQGNLHLIPMEFIIDGESHPYDDSDQGLDLVKFYGEIKKKINIKTSQITPALYESYFEPYLQKGISVLYLCLSSGLSSTFQSACTAANNLKQKYPTVDFVPIDSLGATTMMGILAERMINNQQQGLSIWDNKKDIEAMRGQIDTVGAIGDLIMLKRGGRINAATAFFGGILKIKPIIQIVTTDGSLRVLDKRQGTAKSLKFLLDHFLANRNPNTNFVYITHTDELEKAQSLADAIKAAVPNIEIRMRFLSPIIGAHLGPDTVTVGFIKRTN